ncbi:alkaline phosphatase D family protein [Crossiella sp. SN42]|uniref:alkaline phosphatase D family protein n=1 Tax=Crossiella sp. SN42 TaxID=2944808 RepID=UPI00207C7C0A|nr:alkaline phosphatase D family protein [Crossiella sp. SN42]MCO1576171.1 alkaline phosphatase D family protein [Crossiella sp. SN42]
MSLNRRLFLVTGLATTGALAAPATVLGLSDAPARRLAPLADPFTLGVGSGEPRPDGMVLWTRLAQNPLDPDGGMGAAAVEVEWQVATDAAMTAVVATGKETAVAAEGHSVHAEPRGLQPGREYFYRFKAGAALSPVGRTRTAPAAGTEPAKLTFSFASCAHFEEGWYHAYRYLAADRPDLVLFLGDYMYEKPSGQATKVRGYTDFDETDTLGEYRIRYAQHRLDPMLRAAHAAAPWLVVFDDHELRNNWAGGHTEPAAARRQASFQAFWENMPLPKAMKPASGKINLYRGVAWGSLARFHLMDTRQHRWLQAPAGSCAEITKEARTLTGAAQEKWLLDRLAVKESRWDILGQQVFFAQRDTDGAAGTCDVSTDAWDGYRRNRERITQGWIDRGVRNPVVLTGDVHRAWANNLRLNYFQHSSPIVGAELVTTSITSHSSTTPPAGLAKNPHLNYVGHTRGYVRATLTPAQLTAEFMQVSSVLEKDPAKVTLSVARRFAVLDGKPGVQRL